MYFWIAGVAALVLLVVFVGAALVAGSRDDDLFGRDFQAWRDDDGRHQWR